MTTLLEILHRKAEPYKVTLTRGQKGTYGWEITVSAATLPKIAEALEAANDMMKARFGGGEAHEP